MFMGFNFVLLLLFTGSVWKSIYVYTDGKILIDFNSHGEMYIELIIGICLLITIIPVSLYVIKDHFHIFKKYK